MIAICSTISFFAARFSVISGFHHFALASIYMQIYHISI